MIQSQTITSQNEVLIENLLKAGFLLEHPGIEHYETFTKSNQNVEFNYASLYHSRHGILAAFLLLMKMIMPLLCAVSLFFYVRSNDIIFFLLSVSIFFFLVRYDNQFRLSILGWHGSVKPGIYYKPTEKNSKIYETVSTFKKGYTNFTSPWAFTGDTQTMIPFLLYSHKRVNYSRYWVPTDIAFGPMNNRREEKPDCKIKEAVAVDFAFPDSGFDSSKPLYLITHGLNGGSSEDYILDFTLLALKSGHSVAVMVARGLMFTPTASDSIYHGARIDDIKNTSNLLRKAVGANVKIIGVGYSMGAIILSNYVCSSGTECKLDAAIAMSGLIDCTMNLGYKESEFYWQPVLAQSLKENVIAPSVLKVVEKGICTNDILQKMLTVMDIDKFLVAPYFGYKNVMDYYEEMSCAKHLHQLSIPLLFVNAVNDPIMSHLTFEKYIIPNEMNENLFVFLTEGGGHVGWPMGINPITFKWGWMSEIVFEFTDGILNE